MNQQDVRNAANYVSESVQGIESNKALRPEIPNTLPEKMKDLDNKLYLTIYDAQGKTHEGTKVKLEREGSEWVLTIKLPSGEEKPFTSSNISAITRHT